MIYFDIRLYNVMFIVYINMSHIYLIILSTHNTNILHHIDYGNKL